MNQSYTRIEKAHIDAVRHLPCSVCDQPGPSEAHHIRQDNPWLCVALCPSCHRDPHNGIDQGRKAIWRVKKMDEWDALAITIRRLLTGK